MGKARTEEIRSFILEAVRAHPNDIARITSERFSITLQGVNYHLRSLLETDQLEAEGQTRKKIYRLKPFAEAKFSFEITPEFAEHIIWSQHIAPLLVGVRPNVVDICNYGVTEMLNNVMDHSTAPAAMVEVCYDRDLICIRIVDDGVGIFRKIREELGLEDDRHAILELSKGKLTTDPDNHTGEGLFFSSRMFDTFVLDSGTLYYTRFKGDDWLLEFHHMDTEGTRIRMEIDPKSSGTVEGIFDRFASEHDDWGFTKTHVPVRLAQHEGEKLVSRSQAKRLLARFDRFKEVFLDFADVDTIGPAFADQVFRVFPREHPDIELVYSRANEQVKRMINRVLLGVSDTVGKRNGVSEMEE